MSNIGESLLRCMPTENESPLESLVSRLRTSPGDDLD